MEEKFIPRPTLNPGPDQYKLIRHESAIQSETNDWSVVNFKKQVGTWCIFSIVYFLRNIR